jgi:hypothetical protein
MGSPLEDEVDSIAFSHQRGCDSPPQHRGAHPRRLWRRLAVRIH